jgi:hypothetical protein
MSEAIKTIMPCAGALCSVTDKYINILQKIRKKKYQK